MNSPENHGHYERRRFLRDAAAVAAGVAIGAVADHEIEQEHKPMSTPLSPESGYTDRQVVIEWLPETVARWDPLIEQYSKDYDIDPNVPALIMTIESGGDPKANSGVAQGLMQITKPRATDIATKFLHTPRPSYDLYDPSTSIEFGVANIKQLIKEFGRPDQAPTWDETVGLVAAGYYGGEGAARLYRDKGLSALHQDPGTYAYVRYVTTMWRERHDDKSFAYYYWYHQGNGRALIRDAKKYHMPPDLNH